MKNFLDVIIELSKSNRFGVESISGDYVIVTDSLSGLTCDLGHDKDSLNIVVNFKDFYSSYNDSYTTYNKIIGLITEEFDKNKGESDIHNIATIMNHRHAIIDLTFDVGVTLNDKFVASATSEQIVVNITDNDTNQYILEASNNNSIYVNVVIDKDHDLYSISSYFREILIQLKHTK